MVAIVIDGLVQTLHAPPKRSRGNVFFSWLWGVTAALVFTFFGNVANANRGHPGYRIFFFPLTPENVPMEEIRHAVCFLLAIALVMMSRPPAPISLN